MSCSEKKTTDEPFKNSALATTDVAANKASNYQHRMDEKPRVWCDHYNQPRHTQETCWKIHGKPANWKNKKLEGRTSRVTPSANEADHGTFNKKQMDHLQKLSKSNSSSGIPSVSLAQTSTNSNALSC